MAVKKVRTAAGVAKYNLPIGSEIHTGDVPFKVTKLTIHHSNDDDTAAIVASAGPTKRHTTIHTAKTAGDHLGDIYDNNEKLIHTFHNIRGRMFRVTNDKIHAQMDSGAFVHVGTFDDHPNGYVVRHTAKWKKLRGKGSAKGTPVPSQRAALEHLVDPPPNGSVFKVTAQLRDVYVSKDNAHMRTRKEGETKTHDGQPIPPDWTQVEMSSSPDYMVQARGRNSMGKVATLYSIAHKEAKLQEKRERGRKIIKAMPKLDAGLKKANLATDDTAAAVYLMRHTGARVDSSKNGDGDKPDTVKGIRAFGASSIQAGHVKFSGTDQTHFDFIGKSGKRNTYTVHDKRFADAMRKRVAGKPRNARVFDTDASQTAAYIRQHLQVETDRPNHDLRTHMATTMAAKMVNDLGDDELPTTLKEHKQYVNWVGDTVADQINDTRAVALGSYIDPTVLERLQKNLPTSEQIKADEEARKRALKDAAGEEDDGEDGE